MDGTLWQRLVRGICRVRHRPDWEQLAGADYPLHIMDVDVTDSFHAKQGRSTGRLVLTRDGRRLSVFLKRHYQLPFWQGLLAALWPGRGWSPAVQEWERLEWARRQGMPVPATVAVCEYIGPWGRLQSFLAVEELSGMVPLHRAIPAAQTKLSPADWLRWKRGLVVELARLARELHGRRWFHKDLYLCHFFIPGDDLQRVPDAWRGRVHVIDLHRLAYHPHSWRVWQVKDLAELLYSSDLPGITDRDRVRFWRHYMKEEGPWRAGRWLRRLVLWKWQRYRRHNDKRKKLMAA